MKPAALKSFAKPNPLFVLADTAIRAIRGQLHLPPLWLRDVGPDDFEKAGKEFLDLFIRLGNLQSDERVLDIGCGCGRVALPLTEHLSQTGTYVGMDVTAKPVMWCQKNITPQYPNFQFYHMDLYNKRYNPNGRSLAKDYTFPFDNESFDFIFLTSVFTHLLPADTENYLNQISRLLSQNGRAFITFFLLNDIQQTLASQRKNSIKFIFGSGPYRMRDESIPESAVAYDEVYLRKLLTQCGLEILGPIHYGTWSGRTDGLSYQDILMVQCKR